MEHDRHAMLHGLVAVSAFAATLPMTRLALHGFLPLPLTFARLLGATIPAGLLLRIVGAPPPTRRQLGPLLLVAAGAVLGFPLLVALALQRHPAAPGAIALALLPLATAGWAWLRGFDRPSPAFWLWALAGSALVGHFVWNGPQGQVAVTLFAAVGAAAVAYGEGGRLAREMPGWRVMAWALVLAAPVTAVGCCWSWAGVRPPTAAAPWLALGFLALVSQFGAYWFWYRALAAGVAQGAQIQLLQPFLTLLLAATLLGERVPPTLWLYAAGVVVTVYLARNAHGAIGLGRRATS